MSDFVELKKGSEIPNRRWFMSPDLDLIIFFNKTGEIQKFQLCYDKKQHEQMLSWDAGEGYLHMAIDSGEDFDDMGYKRTPLIIPNGSYSVNNILDKLLHSSEQLPADVFDFVKEKIAKHPLYKLPQST